MRILVVDDEADIRETMCLLLEHLGHTASEACNGLRALEIAEKAKPEVVLLDLNMPVMDGFTAARRLRELPATAHSFIAAVSAYVSNKDWCDRALAAGADECVGKPLSYERLDLLLATARDQARQR